MKHGPTPSGASGRGAVEPVRVVVVDDDYLVAQVQATFVDQTPGFTVVGLAHNGVDALRLVTETKPHLVLLDIHLPDIDGHQVLGQLRSSQPDIDVLVITAAREVNHVRRALRGGAVHYLMKPFSAEDLRTRLEHYLRAHRGLDTNGPARQADVDRMFGGQTAVRRTALPKGLSTETADAVERQLRAASGSVSTAECSEALGISRVSARRYLEHFAATGAVSVALRYGHAGRPERRYTWTSVPAS